MKYILYLIVYLSLNYNFYFRVDWIDLQCIANHNNINLNKFNCQNPRKLEIVNI